MLLDSFSFLPLIILQEEVSIFESLRPQTLLKNPVIIFHRVNHEKAPLFTQRQKYFLMKSWLLVTRDQSHFLCCYRSIFKDLQPLC